MASFSATIDRSKLDEAQRHLLAEGWAVIPDVLTKDESAEVLTRLWKAKEAGEARGDQTRMAFLDPNESNVRVFYLMELDKIFRDLISHPTAVEMVKAVLGESFIISNFTANIARPGSKSMALHSDQSIVMPDPWKETWALNCIWCLTDVYKENGATLYIPGSNKWVVREDIPADAPKLLRPFEAKAGSIILMNGRVWHTSGSNVTADQDRALLFGYYTASFLRQQVNWTAKLSKEVQDGLSEEMRSWLGLNVDANVGATGDLRYMVCFDDLTDIQEVAS
jgi:ectoine hydroxylase-related dioxygenase (phytanoyl-CoA dioxygenase family)